MEIRYDLIDEDLELFRRGIDLLSELDWAAGARRLFLPVRGLAEQTTPSPRPLRDARLRPSDLTLMAFHPLGTARADVSPFRGVVDGELALHGVDGVYVADGSVVPSALGVNPQMTIMALATRLAFGLLGKPPPVDEPEPEAIARPRVGRAHGVAA